MSSMKFWRWTALSAILGGLLLTSASNAQRGEFRSEPPPDRFVGGGLQGPVGRFQLVRYNELEIIILDTVTGDLFSAKPGDVKPYRERHRSGMPPFEPRGTAKTESRAPNDGPRKQEPADLPPLVEPEPKRGEPKRERTPPPLRPAPNPD